jgi:hypothetical protein
MLNRRSGKGNNSIIRIGVNIVVRAENFFFAVVVQESFMRNAPDIRSLNYWRSQTFIVRNISVLDVTGILNPAGECCSVVKRAPIHSGMISCVMTLIEVMTVFRRKAS